LDLLTRVPQLEHREHRNDRCNRGEHIRQFDGEEVGGEKLDDREHEASDNGHRPRLPDTAATVDQQHQQQWYEHGHERRLTSRHRSEVLQREAGHAGESEDWCTERAERDGSRVGEQRDHRGLERFHASREQHGGGDRDRCTEAGE